MQKQLFVPEFEFNIESIVVSLLQNSSVPELQGAAGVIARASAAMTDAQIAEVKTQLQTAETELGQVNKDYDSLKSPVEFTFVSDAETAFNAANPAPAKPGFFHRGATEATYQENLAKYNKGLNAATEEGEKKYRDARTAHERQKAGLEQKRTDLAARIGALTTQSQSPSKEAIYQSAAGTLDAYVNSINPYDEQRRGQTSAGNEPVHNSLSNAQLGQQYIPLAAELAKSGNIPNGQAATGATSALQAMVQTIHESLEDDVQRLEPQLRFEAAKLYVRGGSYEEALSELSIVQNLINPVPNVAPGKRSKGKRNVQPKQVMPEQVIKGSDISYLAGISHLRMGNLQEANASLLDAYKSNPNMRGTVPLVEELVAAQARADVGKAVGMLDSFTVAGAFDAEGSSHLLLRVAEGLRAEDANRAYEAASKVDNSNVGGRASYLMGEIKASANDLGAAVSNYRESVLANPFNEGYKQTLRGTYLALAAGADNPVIDTQSLDAAVRDKLVFGFKEFKRSNMGAAEAALNEALGLLGYQRYNEGVAAQGAQPFTLENATAQIQENVAKAKYDPNQRLAIATALHTLANIQSWRSHDNNRQVLGIDSNTPAAIGLINESIAVSPTAKAYQYAAFAVSSLTPLR